MFTRIVECYVKREKKQEFTDKLQQVVLPILHSQAGFVDALKPHETHRVIGGTNRVIGSSGDRKSPGP